MQDDRTYIKLFHKMLGWGWYKDVNTKVVFLHILLRANYKPSEYYGYEIKAGECVFGYKAWSEELGLSVRQMRTAIEHLKSTGEITMKSTNKFSIITVANWDIWQVCYGTPTSETTSKTTNHRQASDKQATTPKDSKNNISSSLRSEDIYIDPKPKSKKFKKPSVDEIHAYIDEKGFSINAEYFYDYYESNGWKVGKSPMKDWKACIRRWEKNNYERTDTKRGGSERANTTKSVSESQEKIFHFKEA